MHPSLSVSNFSRLPPALELRASVAVGSPKKTLALLDNLSSIAPEHYPLLLPVVYSALNPTRIPVILARFDSSGWESIKWDIMQAHSCLRGIFILGFRSIPPGASVDLWKTVWPWLTFLDEYDESFAWDYFDYDHFHDVGRRYRLYVSTIRFMNDTDAMPTHLIHNTPGLYVVIGRAWRHLLHANHSDGKELSTLSYWLGQWFSMEKWNPAAFEDLVVGCGGVRGLAAIVVAHIQRMLPTSDSPVTVDKTIYHLFAVVCIVDPGAVPGHRRRPDPTIQDAFRSCGIVTILTTAARALGKSSLDTAGIALRSFLFALLDHVASFPPVWLTDSLRADLLDIFFSPHHRGAISVPLRRLLEEVLIPAAVYHSVLVELRAPLAQVRDRDAAKIFGDTLLLAHWKSFLGVAESRFKILDEYNNGSLMATRACDDVAVSGIIPWLPRSLIYPMDVSPHTTVPQNVKPMTGNAVDTVGCVTTFHLAENETIPVIPPGIGLFCALSSITSIERGRRKSHRSAGSSWDAFSREMPCTIFDFTISSCEIVVVPLKGLKYLGMFQCEVQQTIRCAGTMDLNLMKVIYDAGEPRVWPFPVRVRRVEVEEGQKAIEAGLDELD
ncbi:MYND-type domain-containing protein [Mycena sanguinolenta]|uniref:MYND-type domain-containing protein n=1 Tax=Mycena sanguinolenta TaxID=230812 RepID=A0A8H7CVH4_9AGAR|nr:MYND-type domain-containing protein [Mycena sanguinolenta]